jgi:hypothetical protein
MTRKMRISAAAQVLAASALLFGAPANAFEPAPECSEENVGEEYCTACAQVHPDFWHAAKYECKYLGDDTYEWWGPVAQDLFDTESECDAWWSAEECQSGDGSPGGAL